jgi:hypothetical protein
MCFVYSDFMIRSVSMSVLRVVSTDICCAKNYTSKLALIIWRSILISNGCFISDSKLQEMLNAQLSIHIAFTFITLTNIRSYFFLWLYSAIQALSAFMKLSLSFQLLDLGQSVGLLGRVISLSQGLYLYTNIEKRTHTTQTLNIHAWVGFEPKVPASARAKTVHFLDRSATVTGISDG